MWEFAAKGAHLEFLEIRGLIFSKMRQICIKIRLQISQKTCILQILHKSQMYRQIYFFFSPKISQEFT